MTIFFRAVSATLRSDRGAVQFARKFCADANAPPPDSVVNWRLLQRRAFAFVQTSKPFFQKSSQRYVAHLEDQLSGKFELASGKVLLAGALVGGSTGVYASAKVAPTRDVAAVVGAGGGCFGAFIGVGVVSCWAWTVFPIGFGALTYAVHRSLQEKKNH